MYESLSGTHPPEMSRLQPDALTGTISRMKETHLARPVLQELQELYEISMREHGPQGRSTRIIGEALARERAGAGPSGARPIEAKGTKKRGTERPG